MTKKKNKDGKQEDPYAQRAGEILAKWIQAEQQKRPSVDEGVAMVQRQQQNPQGASTRFDLARMDYLFQEVMKRLQSKTKKELDEITAELEQPRQILKNIQEMWQMLDSQDPAQEAKARYLYQQTLVEIQNLEKAMLDWDPGYSSLFIDKNESL